MTTTRPSSAVVASVVPTHTPTSPSAAAVHAWPRAIGFGLCAGSLAVLAACTTVIEEPVAVQAPPPVVSVYVDPPLIQPDPILVPWAPPPMLVQAPPPPPFEGAVWVGGYWAWEGRWVWSAGYWDRPPQPRYVWVEPYYEHRGNAVVFVNGFWGAPNVAFVPPPPSLHLSLAVTLGGAIGAAPVGPQGIFVPPPPGSVSGLIVPAPLGTPPAVVSSAPAVLHSGMRVVNNNNVTVNNTIINNYHVTNVRNVTVEAPAAATATHAAYNANVPAHAALAAAAPPVTHWQAPMPQTQLRYTLSAAANRAPVALPPPQAVHNAPMAPARSAEQQRPSAAPPGVRPEAARPNEAMRLVEPTSERPAIPHGPDARSQPNPATAQPDHVPQAEHPQHLAPTQRPAPPYRHPEARKEEERR